MEEGAPWSPGTQPETDKNKKCAPEVRSRSKQETDNSIGFFANRM
jgi:hypothetical protein